VSNSAAPTTRQVFIGRQAIFDPQRQVAAYELLYRHNQQTDAAQRGDRNATSVVMVDALMSIGLERLVGAQRAFLNCSVPHDHKAFAGTDEDGNRTIHA
jgi:EAL and modified HD-GYP domain-containing signal transduction protein